MYFTVGIQQAKNVLNALQVHTTGGHKVNLPLAVHRVQQITMIVFNVFAKYFTSCPVVAVLFDLSNLYSLSHCAQWLEEALACNTVQPIIFLIGTKRDLLVSFSKSNCNIK